MAKKDKTSALRQSRLREARKKWIIEHGYKSAEGLIGALVRGEVILQAVNAPIPTPLSSREGEVCAECGLPPSHHDPSAYVWKK